jgi:hypothetical protein
MLLYSGPVVPPENYKVSFSDKLLFSDAVACPSLYIIYGLMAGNF